MHHFPLFMHGMTKGQTSGKHWRSQWHTANCFARAATAFALALLAGLTVGREVYSQNQNETQPNARAAGKGAVKYLSDRGAWIGPAGYSLDLNGFHPRPGELGVEFWESIVSFKPTWKGRDEDFLRIADVPNVAVMEFWLFNHKISHPEIFAFLPKMGHLRSLMIEWESPFTDACVRYVSQCHNLEELTIGNGDISDDGMAELAKLTSLRDLRIESDSLRLTSAGVAHLAKLTSLRKLSLTFQCKDAITDKAVAALAPLRNLEVLFVDGNITDAAMPNIVKFDRLRELSIRPARITDKGLAVLAKLKTLRELDVRGTGVTEAGVRSFRKAVPQCEVRSAFDKPAKALPERKMTEGNTK